MFRPEDVEIVPVGQGDMEGRVVSSLFLGDRVRIVLDIASTHTITVDLPARHTVEIGQKLALVIAKKMALSSVDPVLC
jgi:ABC-type Fe3+/spermidine/putrescine transport system ATPase subunit